MIKENHRFDTLIFTTVKDFLRLGRNYRKLVEFMPAENLIFVGNTEVGKAVKEAALGERVIYMNEEEILPFRSVQEVMKKALEIAEVPRGITGWYYQQFLKMQYSSLGEHDYYLVWDGDTVPCREFSMFCEKENLPYFDLKREYHEEYFKTLEKILPGMHKCIEESFISEHMLINAEMMKNLIKDIEDNKALKGNKFYEKIILAIDQDKLTSNSFSEFETYGTYVCFKYFNSYRLRRWNSFRYGGEFFDPEQITEEDYKWLGKDFDAISFEKNHFVREDHRNLFNNREYQNKLSARQMLEIAQEEFKEGYIEVWEN